MVASGLTVTLVPVTAPRPGEIERLVAPVTVQESTEAWPGATAVGDAVKEPMVGREGATPCSAPVRQPDRPSAKVSAARSPTARCEREPSIDPPGWRRPRRGQRKKRGEM